MEELKTALNHPDRRHGIIAVLKSTPLNHVVVVDQVDQGGVIHVRDPREGKYGIPEGNFGEKFRFQCWIPSDGNLIEDVRSEIHERIEQQAARIQQQATG